MVLAVLVPLFANLIRLYFKYPKTIILKVLDGLYVCFALFYFVSNNVEHYNFINKNLVQYGWILYLGITLDHLIRRVIAKDRDAF